VTVGDDGQVSRPRMSLERKAKLGVEAWRLKDSGESYRGIADMFTRRGDEISHTQVGRLIKEAREAAEFIDLIAPAEMRANQLGYLDGAIERTSAEIETGGIEFANGMKLLIQLIKLQKEISGSAMPTRMQIEDVRNEPPPSVATIRAFAAEIDKYRAARDERGPDGLEEFDH
jgi:hypothetical protein